MKCKMQRELGEGHCLYEKKNREVCKKIEKAHLLYGTEEI